MSNTMSEGYLISLKMLVGLFDSASATPQLHSTGRSGAFGFSAACCVASHHSQKAPRNQKAS